MPGHKNINHSRGMASNAPDMSKKVDSRLTVQGNELEPLSLEVHHISKPASIVELVRVTRNSCDGFHGSSVG